MTEQVRPNLTVDRAQAENFGKVWTHRGVSIPLSDVSLQFATDFANVVLLSFVSKCQQDAAAAKQTVNDKGKKIMIEG